MNPALFIYFVILTSVTEGTERSGSLTDTDLADIEDLLNSVRGEVRSIEISPPPQSSTTHRDKRILCRLGDNLYCPGEVLFRKKMRTWDIYYVITYCKHIKTLFISIYC